MGSSNSDYVSRCVIVITILAVPTARAHILQRKMKKIMTESSLFYTCYAFDFNVTCVTYINLLATQCTVVCD
jgi:hypothetical protein